jgi:hypothetical protein
VLCLARAIVDREGANGRGTRVMFPSGAFCSLSVKGSGPEFVIGDMFQLEASVAYSKGPFTLR